MIFYLLGLLSYYKIRNKPVPAPICLLFFGVVTIPPATTLYFFLDKHWTFQLIAFAGGIFCWTFFEYFIHRFLMHGKEKAAYHKTDHFRHHINPATIFLTHIKRISFLLLAILGTCGGIFLSNYLFLPAGILTGLALYSYVHVWLHQAWAEKWLGSLQRFHMQHHLGQTEKCFGVTNTLWDRVFNTSGTKERPAAPKARKIYFAS